MKLTIAYLCLVMVSTTVLAQSNQPEQDICGFQLTWSDNSCTDQHNCVETTGCAHTTFTVPCDSVYCFKVTTSCSAGDCSLCRTCANIYKDGFYVAGSNCHNSPCSACSYSCCETGQRIRLATGITYDLYVCLLACEGQSCESCRTCSASATLVLAP